MVKGKKEFKSQTQISGKNKQIYAGNILKSGNRKNYMKKDLEKKVKFKDTKQQQNSENFNLSLGNKDAYKCQLDKLKMMLQDLSHHPTLTQDELKILFFKYKLDGHFEAKKNLPSFSELLGNIQNTMTDNDCFYNKSKHTFDTQYIHYNNNKNTCENLYYNNVNENQQNFEHNVYRQQENHSNEVWDIGNDFPSNSVNMENISPEGESNNFPHSAQHKNYQNIGGNSQQYDMQHINQPWESNMCYDFHTKEWNANMFLTNKNDDYQLWRNQQSNFVPETNNSEWQYGVNILPEQNALNTCGPNINLYTLENNENSDCTATTNHNYHEEQDFDTNNSGSILSSFTNIVKHYI